MQLDPNIERAVLDHFSGSVIKDSHLIQNLWSGYGQLLRLKLSGLPESVIVKYIKPIRGEHRYGWDDSFAHERKLKSYQVEWNWYASYNQYRAPNALYPTALHLEQTQAGTLFLLEDLDGLGFARRLTEPKAESVKVVLKWLANFHAKFFQMAPNELWPEGTYWHLATRPEELKALASKKPGAEKSAQAIANKLKAAQFQTFVHGDAKLANFCFTPELHSTGAVDFQYVGAGPGIKDVAYFLSSVYSSDELYKNEAKNLGTYFQELQRALLANGFGPLTDLVIAEWRELYDVAWADFVRFLLGWQPEHWKLHPYAQQKWQQVCAEI